MRQKDEELRKVLNDIKDLESLDEFISWGSNNCFGEFKCVYEGPYNLLTREKSVNVNTEIVQRVIHQMIQEKQDHLKNLRGHCYGS